MENEKSYIAQNGIRLYATKNENIHSFFISLFLRSGSMYERDDECGLTHFLEHAVIRNVNSLMGGVLYSELDSRGLEFNASTYSEMVQFYTSGAEKNFRYAADIISKVLDPIVLTPSEIKTECERVKAEIRESDDKTALSTFANNIVHEGTTLSKSILGTAGGISRITRSRLAEYRKKNFTPDNIFLYVTGNFTDDDVEYLLAEIGKRELSSGEYHDNTAPVPKKFGKRERKVHIKNADFTMVRFNFDMDMSAIGIGEDDLLYDILLGGYNSRFFIEMSEERGLFYDLTGSVEHYKNIGTFSFSFEVRAGTVYESIEMTLSILSKLKRELLSEGECMKAAYVDNALMLADDAREMNFTFAYDSHIMGAGYKSLAERSSAYAAITPERIRAAAREIFRSENLTLTMKASKRKTDISRIEKILDKFANNEL